MRHAWIALALWGCTSDAVPPPDVALSVGQESTAWVDAPQAKSIEVDLVPSGGGAPAKLTEVGAPTPAVVDITKPSALIVPIPEEHFTGSVIASFEAKGLDAAGNAVLHGKSIYYSMTSIYAVRIPIFVGRAQTWARPVSRLASEHLRPLVTTLYELLIAAGGDPIPGKDPAVPDFFDTAVWQTVGSQPPLPRAPKSMASIGTKLVMIDNAGGSWVNLSDDTTGKLPDPNPSLDFSQVAGGDTFEQPGLRFIIGGTRLEGAPTDKVLVLNDQPDKVSGSVLTLSTPRLGATAGFMGTTLVVVGGSATGAGVEILPKDATSFMPLAYPPDATAGLGFAPLDDKTALLVGGQDPMGTAPSPLRTIDVTCTATCAATEVGMPPMPLNRTKVFVLGPSQILFAGEADDGMNSGVNHVFSIDPSQTPPFTPMEIGFKDGRSRAKATPARMPNGQVALVGGYLLDGMQSPATSLEIFIP
jgi:hypothetical protein